MDWNCDREVESIVEETHYYHYEEGYGRILGVSYDPRTCDIKIIAEEQSYTEFLPSQKTFKFKHDDSSFK